MRVIGAASTILAITLAAGVAGAQTPPAPAPGGAFENLSPGNQKIALAIFDSQQRMAATAPIKQNSLDEIAQMKQGGKGWGVIFKDMQGQVQDKNLGQAVSRFNRSYSGSSAHGTEITTAGGRTSVVGGRERPDVALSGRRGSGPDDARPSANTSVGVTHGREGGGSGAAVSRGGGGTHGVGRGK